MSDVRRIPAENLDSLTSGCRLAYQTWLERATICVNCLTNRTFYLYRSKLLPFGVDIAAVNPKENANVVPLVRVLEAVPMAIPEWAKDTTLYFDLAPYGLGIVYR